VLIIQESFLGNDHFSNRMLQFRKRKMIRLLWVGPDKSPVSNIYEYFKNRSEISAHNAESGAKALELISVEKPDLVIVNEDLQDMTGFEFAEKQIMTNPLVNCAFISSMPASEFHEATEGMGILMKLSPSMNETQLEELLTQLKKIEGLTGDNGQ
jgi:two-component SAPR family response regulator